MLFRDIFVFRGVTDQNGAPCRPVSGSFNQLVLVSLSIWYHPKECKVGTHFFSSRPMTCCEKRLICSGCPGEEPTRPESNWGIQFARRSHGQRVRRGLCLLEERFKVSKFWNFGVQSSVMPQWSSRTPLYLCIFISLYLCISVSLYLYISVSLNLCISVSLYHYISVSLYLCIFISLYLYISVSLYLYIFISLYL